MQTVAPEPAHTLLLRPRAPFIARDARPFSADPGARAMTLDWPLPQTLAGAIRTHVGEAMEFDWRKGGPALARGIAVEGPLLVGRHSDQDDWEVYLPTPGDALLVKGQPRPVRPDEDLPEGAGCNLPEGLLPLRSDAAEKPDASEAFWSLSDQVEWLADPAPSSPPRQTVRALPREVRVHIGMEPGQRTAREGALFSTAGLVFQDTPYQAESEHPWALRRLAGPALGMLCRVIGAPAAWAPAPALFPMGGERRLVDVQPNTVAWPALPDALRHALIGRQRLRLQLATPALFGAAGWRPDWVDAQSLRGSPPGLPDLTLRLISAAVGRRIPVSGWDLEKRAPKSVRFAAPAGSVYFFSVVGGPLTADQVTRVWLRSLVSDPQDRRDGFGLAVPGTW